MEVVSTVGLAVTSAVERPLFRASPRVRLLCEETCEGGEALDWSGRRLVGDPVDGTKEMLARRSSFAFSRRYRAPSVSGDTYPERLRADVPSAVAASLVRRPVIAAPCQAASRLIPASAGAPSMPGAPLQNCIAFVAAMRAALTAAPLDRWRSPCDRHLCDLGLACIQPLPARRLCGSTGVMARPDPPV